jgi:hypothetical protein
MGALFKPEGFKRKRAPAPTATATTNNTSSNSPTVNPRVCRFIFILKTAKATGER